jgi:hypothetical protein
MEKKTALQQLNETLEYRKENCNPADAAVYSVVQHFIEQLKPVEREQMEDAWNDGHECGWQIANEENGSTNTMDSGAYSDSFEHYFNQTYKQE